MTTRTQGREVRAATTHPEQLEAFYREHLPFVRNYVARRLDDAGDIADVTADIFLRVVRSAATYQAQLGPPRAWLTGIARNAVAEHRQAGARYAAAARQAGGRRWLDEDSTERIVQRVAAESEARALLAHIADLPVPLRSVVELVAVDGLTVTDAAAVLQISAGTARVRYHRARRQLRESAPFPRPEVTP
ncbi:RNA polymerase sigma factor [Kineosporia rhizophila]|uniref:RNA polymerase sigma factor n=1 Tax=Kineosporia TaxID=49184 RepID=UPI001E407258|nr:MULTISPECIES: RNA polymerase sigma factor [Kineosporia]MCE0537605.1 RNA polymerase sigma factor [Kineosporia rhizophila]GLY18881.1 RNA polymerase sigma24 factor [Kineosporia sp. NBRC 101677]